MALRENLVGALRAVRGKFHFDPDFLKVLLQYLLVHGIVFDEQHLVAFVTHPLLNLDVALLLVLDEPLRRGPVVVQALLAFLSRVEDDREAGGFDWLGDIRDLALGEQLFVSGSRDLLEHGLLENRVGEDKDLRPAAHARLYDLSDDADDLVGGWQVHHDVREYDGVFAAYQLLRFLDGSERRDLMGDVFWQGHFDVLRRGPPAVLLRADHQDRVDGGSEGVGIAAEALRVRRRRGVRGALA